ncbi:carbamoyltransferase C-terminal domain-containing protein [Sphingomonas molluscorum]|uniref:carbamoyltransferase C-terminal domain-containing protein n=1 Tax=Sphingomonas molluscorum TaxID=418184 RepID=UPI0031D3AF49
MSESENLIEDVAHSLAEGQVVAIHQGSLQSGPRALCHRSILASPREGEMGGYINAEVKHRECFRPLAPVMRLESAPRYLEMSGESPFMRRRVWVRPEWRETLGAITHVDGSARVQTVTREQNEFISDLLAAMERIDGLDVLLNTSFNGADESIVESLSDACAAFRRMKIDKLIAPPFILTKA